MGRQAMQSGFLNGRRRPQLNSMPLVRKTAP
jgi:hypothetical protein